MPLNTLYLIFSKLELLPRFSVILILANAGAGLCARPLMETNEALERIVKIGKSIEKLRDEISALDKTNQKKEE
jgi:hypothetical protein